MAGVNMGENKKKIRKKDLLRRIEDLEMKVRILQDKIASVREPVQVVAPDTILTRPIVSC